MLAALGWEGGRRRPAPRTTFRPYLSASHQRPAHPTCRDGLLGRAAGWGWWGDGWRGRTTPSFESSDQGIGHGWADSWRSR